ncbi:hypothetical protein ACIGXM_28770 [Kitasatospora sp. NPDC052896]|uniref:PH-like domain-containing protein n=1 Tax=Kitasatospora sp. NPDC052896 TaxID=3364061 RepID=UPI0037CC8E7F
MSPAPLAMQQAKVHDWAGHIGWAVGLVILIGLIYWLMRQGWNWRRTLQADLPELPAVPDDPGPAILESGGRYHGSTTAGNWLDRVVAHGLGNRSLAELTLTGRGLLVRRPGAEDLWIPVEDLTGARLESGIAGKVVPAGLLVVGWTLQGRALDSGFRLDRADDHAAWAAEVEQLATGTTATRTTKTEGVTP